MNTLDREPEVHTINVKTSTEFHDAGNSFIIVAHTGYGSHYSYLATPTGEKLLFTNPGRQPFQTREEARSAALSVIGEKELPIFNTNGEFPPTISDDQAQLSSTQKPQQKAKRKVRLLPL